MLGWGKGPDTSGEEKPSARVADQTLQERIKEGRLRADQMQGGEGPSGKERQASTRESPGYEDPTRGVTSGRGSGRGPGGNLAAASSRTTANTGRKSKEAPAMTSSRRFGVTDPSACEAGPTNIPDSSGAVPAGASVASPQWGPAQDFTDTGDLAAFGQASGARKVPPAAVTVAGPRTVAEEVEVVKRRSKYQLPEGSSFGGGDESDSPSDGFQTPAPREPTLDHSRRDRKYLDKVKEYRRQERFRIRVFAASAIDDAVERGRRQFEATPASRRPSDPRPGLVDLDDVDLPTCPICCSNPATVVAVPCDHCCICRECAARQRVMSVGSASAERREAEQALARAEQQERAARSREETMQMALTSGRADLALTPGVRESIEADLHDARVRREAALYVRHVPATTRCPVCSFRIDAMLDLTRVAQLRRAYGGAAALPESFTVGFASGWPGRTRAAARAFAQHARDRGGPDKPLSGSSRSSRLPQLSGKRPKSSQPF